MGSLGRKAAAEKHVFTKDSLSHVPQREERVMGISADAEVLGTAVKKAMQQRYKSVIAMRRRSIGSDPPINGEAHRILQMAVSG